MIGETSVFFQIICATGSIDVQYCANKAGERGQSCCNPHGLSTRVESNKLLNTNHVNQRRNKTTHTKYVGSLCFLSEG